jgi:hypothetical protein
MTPEDNRYGTGPVTLTELLWRSVGNLWLRRVLRPLGRLFRTDRWEAHVVVSCHCCACGRRFAFVMPESTREFDRQSGTVDMLECPECGLHTVCSD